MPGLFQVGDRVVLARHPARFPWPEAYALRDDDLGFVVEILRENRDLSLFAVRHRRGDFWVSEDMLDSIDTCDFRVFTQTRLAPSDEIAALRTQRPELVGALEASLRQQIDYLSQMVLTVGVDHAQPGSGRAVDTAFSNDLSVTADGNLAVPTSEQLLADMQRNIFDALRIPERYLRQPETDSDFLARIRRHSGSQADASGETLDEIGRIFGLTRFGVTTEVVTAAKKSIALLKEWLSPEQLEQYERDGYFEVVGGSTGTRYRIRKPLPFNIDILHQDGSVDDRICVEPQSQSTMRPMADGDILLAQKIALEKNEAETLKIANRRGRDLPAFYSHATLPDLPA